MSQTHLLSSPVSMEDKASHDLNAFTRSADVPEHFAALDPL